MRHRRYTRAWFGEIAGMAIGVGWLLRGVLWLTGWEGTPVRVLAFTVVGVFATAGAAWLVLLIRDANRERPWGDVAWGLLAAVVFVGAGMAIYGVAIVAT